MRLRRPCEHDRYEAHNLFAGPDPTKYGQFIGECPGGEFLPEDAIVIEKEGGEWPDWALNVVLMTFSRVAMKGHVEHPSDLLDAFAVSQVGEPGT